MRMIGITGKAGAGKDTIARWFGRTHNAFLDSFASAIKETLVGMFPGHLTQKHFEDRELKEAVIPGIEASPRKLAQVLGTEFGRAINPDLWVWMLDQRRHRYWPGGFSGYYVVSDVRFENEAEYIRGNGGAIIHVERPGATGAVGVSGHASERGIIAAQGDYLFENCGSIEDLEEKLLRAFPNRPIS